MGCAAGFCMCSLPVDVKVCFTILHFSYTAPRSGNFAEKAGFEPTIPFWGIRTFQARTLSHSVISPYCEERILRYFSLLCLMLQCLYN